jgi:hypothetical protein
MVFEVIWGLILVPAVKPSTQQYVSGLPSNQAVKPVPGGVSARGRYKLVAQVEGSEGRMAERLAAEVEHPL